MIFKNETTLIAFYTVNIKFCGGGGIINKDEDPAPIICKAGCWIAHTCDIGGLWIASRDMNTGTGKYIIHPVPDL